MIKLVVFDMDGVLVDSKGAYVNLIHEKTKAHGFNFTKRAVTNALGLRMIHTLKNLQSIGMLSIKEISMEVHDQITRDVKKLKVCPYVKGALERLKKERVKIVLLTNSKTKYALNFLNRHKLKRYFDLVIGGDKFFDKKDVFGKLYRRFKVKPYQVLYVGDRTSDVSIAKKVGCKPVIVYLSSWEKGLIKDKKYAKYLIKDLRGLKSPKEFLLE